ncbi:hypothetical protein [Pseudarthrobacter sp. efr-133-R2A-89]|uniref:hypothetical protein n=1 Tax=Pseudarthrobacter sp. efr-133-R2A-89 TaxID=3040302 RepID=UPI0025537715|nr:hypothetical protein [Pseudarthrobacter sp. efr-133-R2A-89]
MPQTPRRTAEESGAFSRSIWQRIDLTVIAGVPVLAVVVLLQNLGLGRNFLSMAMLSALALAMVVSGWVVLIHGDLKQRSDTAVALFIAFILLSLTAIAGFLYGEDWRLATICPVQVSYSPDCSDAGRMFKARLNGATLDQIFTVFGVGQIVPLLSILKDAVYCWLKPTPWHEVIPDREARGLIRRTNRQRRILFNDGAAPEAPTGIGHWRTPSTIVAAAIVMATLVLDLRRRRH